MGIDLEHIAGVVGRMRELGVRRLRLADLELDLTDEHPEEQQPDATTAPPGDEWPDPYASVPHLRRLE